MQFEYGKAPLRYIDGIPANKAGEWPGITSCKFYSYKRVIRPKESGILFNENEPPLPISRKLLGPKGPTPEYVFKPCCRMIKEPGDNCKRPEGLRYIPCPSKSSIPRKERRHDFPYKREMDREEIEKNKRMTQANYVRNEFRLMGLVGFAKKPYEGIPYTIVPGNKFNRMHLNSLKMDDDNVDQDSMSKKQLEMYLRKQRNEERKNLFNDMKYVENLISWDKKYLEKDKQNNQTATNNEKTGENQDNQASQGTPVASQ